MTASPSGPSQAQVTIGREGEVALPADLTRELRLLRPEPFLALSDGHHCLHLIRRSAAPELLAGSSRLALFGHTGSFALAEVFSLINMGRRDGTLVVLAAQVSKSVRFQRGEIVFATSNLADDQLGPVLYRTGKIGPETQQLAERLATGGEPLTRLLLERKLIAPDDLWWGVKYQVEEIVYSVFQLTDASFLFFDGEAASGEQVRFTIDTNSVLMEAYRRIDEWSRIGRHIAAPDVVLAKTDTPIRNQLPENMARALGLVDGKRTAAEIIRRTGWGEFNTYHVLFELFKAGLIEAVERPQRSAQNADTGEILQRALLLQIDSYNRAFMLIHDVLQAKQVQVDRLALLRAFLQQAREPVRATLHGVTPGPSGQLAPDLLVANARDLLAAEGSASGGAATPLPEAMGRLIARALDGWVTFQCLVIYNLLPDHEARELVSHVYAIERSSRG